MGDTASLPTGTVTFLFTDIEGSTRLWEQYPDAMRVALARHDALAAGVTAEHSGIVVKSRGEGDSLFVVFSRATDAVAAASSLQRALLAEQWPTPSPLRVRIALHTGEADLRDSDYYGTAVNRCARLRSIAHAGQVLLSLTTEELVREGLPEGGSLRDLGLIRLQDLAHPEHVFQFLHPDLPGEFPPLRSLDTLPNNLPVQLTSFIGREQAITEVKRLLTATHLVTLTGSGGCGKTRLALQVAADLLEEYADGVWLVELAALADPALVPQTVASALGVREQPGRPLTATLVDTLKPKALLLILDNCEHVLAACAQLADALLRSCPSLRILASSREGLGIVGEQTYRVASLSSPDPRHLPPLERLRDFEAVQLFADRARLSQAGFAVTEANAPAVAQVCQRLDGIPLALELAAARVKALSVEKINERLDDMFRLLTGGSRTGLPRQQTLRALIDWSYDILSPPEQALLRRLSVFAGGWTLEAAEAACAGEGVEEWEVLDLLTSLVEKSLVLYEERGGEGRYRLLETVRQYAREKLQDAGEAETVRGRHRDWFLALGERAEPGALGERQVEWLDRLEREKENLRAALAWCLRVAPHPQDDRVSGAPLSDPPRSGRPTDDGRTHDADAGLRLGGALGWFWDNRGYWREGREYLAGLLALPGAEVHTLARAKALYAAGIGASFQSDFDVARGLLKESLAIYQELEHKLGLANSLWGLGTVPQRQGDFAAARPLLEESLTISRELGYKLGIARSLHWLGTGTYLQREHVTARTLWEESLGIFREIGDKVGIASALSGLGYLAARQGDRGIARALHEESLAHFREVGRMGAVAEELRTLGFLALGQGDHGVARARFEELLAVAREQRDRRGLGWALLNLGEVAHAQHDDETARARYQEALAILREEDHKALLAWACVHLARLLVRLEEHSEADRLGREGLAIAQERGMKPSIAMSFEALASVAGAQGHLERTARLFGAAEGLREAMGAPLPPADRAEHDRSVTAVRAALGEEAFAAAWGEGRALSLDQTVSLALEQPEDV